MYCGNSYSSYDFICCNNTPYPLKLVKGRDNVQIQDKVYGPFCPYHAFLLNIQGIFS